MTVSDLIEQLAEYPLETELYAFNGDEMDTMPVTGLLYSPGMPGRLEFQTDEP